MIIPNSKWQRNHQNVEREKYRPGAGEKYTAIGILLEVWDQEKLAASEAPRELVGKMKQSPGILFGLVQLGGQNRYLAFNDTEDLLYLIYGNHLQLEGRKVRVEYENASIETGRIFLQKVMEERHINLDVDLQILDIGGII